MLGLQKWFSKKHHSPNIFRTLLFSFMLVPLIPGVMLQYFSYKAQDRAMEVISREVTQAGESIGTVVDAWVDKNINLARYIAELPAVKNFEKEESSELLVLAKQAIATTIAVRVDDATGYAFARSDGKSLKNYADRPYFKMVQRGEHVGNSVIMV